MKQISLLLLALLILAFTYFQTHQVIGKVVDENGNPVIGATVKVKSSKLATSTNSNGIFTLNVPSNLNPLRLEISAVGFTTKTMLGNKYDSLLVKLIATNISLDEVVVTTGYSNKRNYSFEQMLQGKAAGVSVTNSSASPGSSATIRIRGISSFKSTQTYQPKKNYDKSILLDSINDDNFDNEGYNSITENPFLSTANNQLSTFSIDVDAASYSNVRRFINHNQLPPAGAVRIEEMINYFKYNYPQPTNDNPFSVNTEVHPCPWNSNHQLALIGLQGKEIAQKNLPPCNLVFLVDVSGSMQDENKLPLVQQSLKLLTQQLREDDKIAIVVYAGNAGLVLPSTSGNDKTKIKEAIASLQAGGSTAGGQGIKLAYKTAKENFLPKGNNRVILCTDGDFNVGVSSNAGLEQLIEEQRSTGIFLTVLGFGMGNYKDDKMQLLATKGNGNHAYIDDISEAKKVLINEFGGTLFTIAKDVKLQIEFNPAVVQGYRLIGYENRILAKEDFNNDNKDAGELGSGHTVTALYEIIPTGIKSKELEENKVDALRYEAGFSKHAFTQNAQEFMHIKLRYKPPTENASKLIEHTTYNNQFNKVAISDNFKFAAAVAQFGLLLHNSKYKANASYNHVLKIVNTCLENDEQGYRKEFVHLVQKARGLSQKNDDLSKE